MLLLVVIFRKAGLENVLSHLSSIDPKYFLLASLFYILASFVSALRWGMFLEETFPVGKLFSLYMIGSFFNNILPGVIGGDAVKIYYLYRDTKKGATSFGSVFMDRYIGFFALLTIGLAAGIVAFHDLEKVGMQWIPLFLFAAFVAGSMAFFGLRMGSRFTALANFYDYFHTSLKKKRVLLYTFLLSSIVQVLGIFAVFVIALGIGQRLSLTALFVFLPIIITVTTVPISISGLGIREGAFVLLFGLIGIPPQVSTSISFLWFLSVAAMSLIGLVEYFRYKRNLQLADKPV